MTPMSVAEFDFRNNLAVALTKVLAPHIANSETIVSQSFYIADSVTARISADAAALDKAALDKAALDKREAARAQHSGQTASRQANTNAQSARSEACGDGQPNKADQRCGQIEATHQRCGQIEATHPLRRRDDKVEVRELSVEQAIDMIAALFDEKR